MAEFNYTEYIKNNPLLTVVEEKLLTESLEVNETEEVTEETPSSKTTISALKNEIKEMIKASLNEADEDEVEVDVEDEIEADIEPEVEPEVEIPAGDAGGGLTSDEKEIQDSLKLAYDNAIAIGDQKLADQIGNSITFFTRTHVVER